MKNIKKLLSILLALVLILPLGACSNSDTKDDKTTKSSDEEKFKVILLIPGNLGDKSFFDAANSGMKALEQMEGYETKVVEMTADERKWESAILDAIDQKYDLIISGNSASDCMNKLAVENPDAKFLNFDNSGTEAPSNVYSVTYATNEGSFLAGAFAALLTSNTDIKGINDKKLIGFLGGMDIPGINDFLVGYIQGALYIDPEIKVTTTYAASFVDPAKGKELSLGMYNLGADIAFNVAGQTGLGLIDAALESNNYAIGVDSDQALLYLDSEPDKANKVLTSVVKQINKVIVSSVEKAKDGSLEYGKHQKLGLLEDAVALADNQIYQKLPESIRSKISEIKTKIENGEIEVKSGFKMSTDEISKYRDSVQP